MFTCVEWQVKLRDFIRQMTLCSSEMGSLTVNPFVFDISFTFILVV